MYSVPKVFIPATPIIPNNNKRVEALNQADVSLFSYFSMINSVRKDTKTNIPQYLCINKDQNATADTINPGSSSRIITYI